MIVCSVSQNYNLSQHTFAALVANLFYASVAALHSILPFWVRSLLAQAGGSGRISRLLPGADDPLLIPPWPLATRLCKMSEEL